MWKVELIILCIFKLFFCYFTLLSDFVFKYDDYLLVFKIATLYVPNVPKIRIHYFNHICINLNCSFIIDTKQVIKIMKKTAF